MNSGKADDGHGCGCRYNNPSLLNGNLGHHDATLGENVIISDFGDLGDNARGLMFQQAEEPKELPKRTEGGGTFVDKDGNALDKAKVLAGQMKDVWVQTEDDKGNVYRQQILDPTKRAVDEAGNPMLDGVNNVGPRVLVKSCDENSILHNLFDLLGLLPIPGLDQAAALADSLLYLLEGNPTQAALALAGMVPLAGALIAKGLSAAVTAQKAGSAAADSTRAMAKAMREANNAEGCTPSKLVDDLANRLDEIAQKGDDAVSAAAAAGKKAQDLAKLRKDYLADVDGLKGKLKGLREQGKTPEEIARVMHAARLETQNKWRALTPADKLKDIHERNLKVYGNKDGPTIEWLRKQGKTWEEIAESATRSGGKDMGLDWRKF